MVERQPQRSYDLLPQMIVLGCGQRPGWINCEAV